MTQRNLVAVILALLMSCSGETDASEASTNQPATVGAVTTAVAAAQPAAGGDTIDVNKARVGRCHMGECSWSIEVDREVVQREKDSRLIRLNLLGGTSTHPGTDDGTDYPETASDAKITWNREPHEVHVLCSAKLPSVMMDYDGKLNVDVIDFINGPYGYQESDANLYVKTCHPGEQWSAPGFAQRHGYPQFDEPLDISISRPDEIFDWI